MIVSVYIISRFDERERPYVSTTPPTPERIASLKAQGFQIHNGLISVPSVTDGIPTVGSVIREHVELPSLLNEKEE